MVQAWCPICFNQYGPTTTLRAFGCGHVFCSDCIPKLTKIGCPVCAYDMSPTGASYSGNSTVRTLNEGITKPVFVDFHEDALPKRVDELEIAIELQAAKVIRSRREIISLKKELQVLQAAYRSKAKELDKRLESLQSAEEERVIVVEKALDYAEGLESIVMDILEQEPAQHADARRRLRGLRARLSRPILPRRRTSLFRACVKSCNNFLASIHTPDVFVCVTLAVFVAGYLMVWPELFTLAAS